MMITYGRLPNRRCMTNWPIEGNGHYINLTEMTPEERLKTLEYTKRYTIYFVYFLQHGPGYNTPGLADDEYPTENKLPFIPYHRRSRRIRGLVCFNSNHTLNPYAQNGKLYRTRIAMRDYPVDRHHTRYHGYEELPNLYFHPIPSYGLPLGTLIPQEVNGLIVAEKSVSVSNVMNGTTRLQPVVLQIGQTARALAAPAVKNNQKISDVSVRDVQNTILGARGYLLPYLDVPVSDVKFVPYQRIDSTGILKGVSKNIDWSNQTWLRADTVLLASELDSLFEVYPVTKDESKKTGADKLSIEETVQLVQKIAKVEKLHTTVDP